MSGCNCTGYCHIHGHCPNGETFKLPTPTMSIEQLRELNKMLEQVRHLNRQMDEVEMRIASVHEDLEIFREKEKLIEGIQPQSNTHQMIHVIGTIVCLAIIITAIL